MRCQANLPSGRRIGYESSNHYFYTVPDLTEKVLSCRAVIDSGKSAVPFAGRQLVITSANNRLFMI